MNSKRTAALLIALLLGCSLPGYADELLQGKVQEDDHPVRIKRPATPSLDAPAVAAQKRADELKALVDVGDFDFAKQMAAAVPEEAFPDNTADGGSPPPPAQEATPLPAQADDKEMIIAWEQWHKRVCEAIYHNWIRESQLLAPGRARTTITVTRDRHISVSVEEVEVYIDPSGMFQQSPVEQLFAQHVVSSVEQLDGSSLLEFPARSRRADVTFTPNFEIGHCGPSGYDWRHGDYERVPVD